MYVYLTILYSILFSYHPPQSLSFQIHLMALRDIFFIALTEIKGLYSFENLSPYRKNVWTYCEEDIQ